MYSAAICFNHQPPLRVNRRRDGGRNRFRMAALTGWFPAPSNRASGPVRAGKPSWPSPDDLAARVPHFLVDAEVLPSTFSLPVAVEGKHAEHIVDQVEKALQLEEN